MALPSQAECRQRVTTIVVERLHLPVSSPDADLVATGVLDSLGLVELVAQLEGEFGTTIPFEEIEVDSFRSIDAVVTYLTEHLARQPG